jgi:hypothetical protein
VENKWRKKDVAVWAVINMVFPAHPIIINILQVKRESAILKEGAEKNE